MISSRNNPSKVISTKTPDPSALNNRSTGARVYYFRNILHDYPDEKCLAILKNTAVAMDEHSLIFIDEMILSAFKPYYQAAEMDLMMMLALAGAERTDKEWETLIDAAGLKIKEIFTYNKLVRQSIIVLVRK
jgi:demethylsterigmatocystin 6-O-methyltransferase